MWKCKNCDTENADERTVCSECREIRTVSSSGTVEWRYSGKALRARCWLFCFCTLSLLAAGFAVSLVDGLAGYRTTLWGILGAAVLMMWVHFACVYWYRTQTIVYRLTEHRFEYVQGIFTRSTDPLELLYIDDIKLEIHLWDRLINGGVGTITIYSTVDKTGGVLKVQGVEHPEQVYQMIDDARVRIRAKRGFITA